MINMNTSKTDEQKPSELESTYVLNGNHSAINFLIYHQNDSSDGKFIVFVDHEYDLDWECDKQFGVLIDAAPLKESIRKILNGVALLEPMAHNWPNDLKLSAKRLLGEAIVSVLLADVKGAEAVLENARIFFKEKSKQVSRFWTLQACLVSGGVATLGLTIAALGRSFFRDAFGLTPFLLLCCFLSGCIGATLFVVLRLGKEPKVDSTAERHLHHLEGFARVVGGGIAGVLVGSLVKLGLILPVFGKTGMEALAMCASALLAGASERLAAGIITKVDNNEPLTKETTNAND
jgi:hypothetical protein